MPSDTVYENENVLVFKNIEPEAPVHLLAVPKRHIEWSDLGEKELSLLAEVIAVAKKVAIEKNISNACKLIFNIGKTGHIAHIHLHILGGWKEKIPMNNI